MCGPKTQAKPEQIVPEYITAIVVSSDLVRRLAR